MTAGPFAIDENNDSVIRPAKSDSADHRAASNE